MELTGRRIVVTGGARGIGAAVVRGYVLAGATVLSMDVRDDLGAQEAREATEKGPGSAVYVNANVADRAAVSTPVNTFAESLGGLDVLVHAAAIEYVGPAEHITTKDWDHLFSINVTGTLHVNQAVFPHMREGGGAIINFASGAGVRGYSQHGHYAASKGAVLAWTRTIAMEWGKYGITANAICPGMRTPLYEATRANLSPEELERHDARIASTTPIDGRLGTPERDLVPFMIFMAGPGARYITGQTLPVDGGRTMVR